MKSHSKNVKKIVPAIVQIRLQGASIEVQKIAAIVNTIYNVCSISREYENPGTNAVRVYINVHSD